MADVTRWSITPASNQNIDTESGAAINASEGQTPGLVNNDLRSVMAALTRWRKDNSGEIVSTGAANTYNVTANTQYASLVDGMTVSFRAHQTNSGASTLQVNSLTARSIVREDGSALQSGDIVSGAIYAFTYVLGSTHWRLLGRIPTAVSDGDKGDIVVSSSGTVWSLDSSLNFTGKTITGGTYSSPTINTPTITAPVGLASINGASLAGLRNRLINGCMRINQRSATSVADDVFCFDRWYALHDTGNITVGSQTLIANGWTNAIRLTQPDVSAKRFGLAQIIESSNCIDLRGQSVTLSAKIRCSNSTNIRAAIIEWTGTADTVTSDIVNNWASSTYTAGNFFTTTSTTVSGVAVQAVTANTARSISLTATLGSSFTNLVVFVWAESAQAQNSTLDIGDVQLEHGATATVFERRPVGLELSLCQRYYVRIQCGTNMASTMLQCFSTTAAAGSLSRFPVEMRTSPTGAASAVGDFNLTNSTFGLTGALSALPFTVLNRTGAYTNGATISSGTLAAGNATQLYGNSASFLEYAAEL